MKTTRVFICILLALVIVLSACSGAPGQGAKKSGNSVVTEGVMTTAVDNDSKPTGPITTTFNSATPIVYCSFKISEVVPEDMVKVSWYYVKGEAVGHENELINETFTITESDAPSYHLAFYLDKPVSGWYKGDYKVVISINNAEKLSVPFTIK